jgi:hypothetical protein
VRYAGKYIDATRIVIKSFSGDKPGVKSTPMAPGVIEVITRWHYSGVTKRSWTKNNKVKDYNGIFRREGSTRFKIHSFKLINALRAVVEYYTGQDLTGEELEFDKPFRFLVHHMDKLDKYKPEHPRQYSSEYQRECNEHIDLLLSLIDEYVGKDLAKEKSRHSRGLATFDNLWMPFKPGEKLFT